MMAPSSFTIDDDFTVDVLEDSDDEKEPLSPPPFKPKPEFLEPQVKLEEPDETKPEPEPQLPSKRRPSERYKCSKCCYHTSKYAIFLAHVDLHLSSEKYNKFICKACSYMAFNKSQLSMHKAKCGANSRVIKCTQCKFTTIKHKHLNKHMKLHEKGFKKNCGQCKFETTTTSAMRQHFEEVHRPRYKCECCDFMTTTRKILEAHGRAHHKVTKRTLIKCDLCDYESYFKGNVRTHRTKHLQLQS